MHTSGRSAFDQKSTFAEGVRALYGGNGYSVAGTGCQQGKQRSAIGQEEPDEKHASRDHNAGLRNRDDLAKTILEAISKELARDAVASIEVDIGKIRCGERTLIEEVRQSSDLRVRLVTVDVDSAPIKDIERIAVHYDACKGQ